MAGDEIADEGAAGAMGARMMLRYWIYFRMVFLSYLPLMFSVVFIVVWNPVGDIDRFIAGMTIPAAVATSYALFFSGWIGGIDRWMTSQIFKADELGRRSHSDG